MKGMQLGLLVGEMNTRKLMKQWRSRAGSALVAILAGLFSVGDSSPVFAADPVIEPFYIFPPEGLYQLPRGDLIKGPGGFLYGTTVYGGPANTGTVYRLATDGSFVQLHAFGAVTDDHVNAGGAYPQAGVVFGSDGKLYGTTVYGGAHGGGTIYRLTLNESGSATAETVHEFSDIDGEKKNDGGANSYASLVAGTDGALYGVTQAGGSGGNGTIFRLTSDGQFTTLHDFNAFGVSVANPDGAQPMFRLTSGLDGNLYGATETGGEYGFGTIFRITPTGVFATLHSFGATPDEGLDPISVTFGSDGALYGLTQLGSPAVFRGIESIGTIFRYTAAKGVETLLYFSKYPARRCCRERTGTGMALVSARMAGASSIVSFLRSRTRRCTSSVLFTATCRSQAHRCCKGTTDTSTELPATVNGKKRTVESFACQPRPPGSRL
ncbi:MAG TPA: choice-of-anchor tandem repeat GloVer-containing protein [Povalibacter sp.]|nr:choice-of-anchor tandem repeat GloVer-containing protein [Povalibacter sp.]